MEGPLLVACLLSCIATSVRASSTGVPAAACARIYPEGHNGTSGDLQTSPFVLAISPLYNQLGKIYYTPGYAYTCEDVRGINAWGLYAWAARVLACKVYAYMSRPCTRTHYINLHNYTCTYNTILACCMVHACFLAMGCADTVVDHNTRLLSTHVMKKRGIIKAIYNLMYNIKKFICCAPAGVQLYTTRWQP